MSRTHNAGVGCSNPPIATIISTLTAPRDTRTKISLGDFREYCWHRPNENLVKKLQLPTVPRYSRSAVLDSTGGCLLGVGVGEIQMAVMRYIGKKLARNKGLRSAQQ